MISCPKIRINTMENRPYIDLATLRLHMDERDVRIVRDIVDIARRLCATPEKMPGTSDSEPCDIDEASRLLIKQMLEEDKKAQMPEVRVKLVSKDRSGIIRAARKQLVYNAERSKVQVLTGDEPTEDEDDGFIPNVDDLDPEDMKPPSDMAGLVQHVDEGLKKDLGLYKADVHIPKPALEMVEDLLVNSPKGCELYSVDEGTPPPPLSLINEDELSEEEQIRLGIESSLSDQ